MKFKITRTQRGFWVFAFVLFAPMLFLYQNCSKVGVSDIVDGAGLTQSGTPGVPPCAAGQSTCQDNPVDPGTPVIPPPDTCTTTITTTADNVKVFFLVDVSGSNQTGDSKNGNTPTDPSVLKNGVCKDITGINSPCKNWRVGVLNDFLGTYLTPTKSNFSFQLGTFQGGSATALITQDKKTLFSNDSMMVNNAVTSFLNVKDNSGTPYQAVLNMAAAAIKYDIGNAAVPTSKYVIIMITDGMPSDDEFNHSDENTNIANLKNAVSQVVNVAPGYITFNTVLYYPPNHVYQDAEKYLQAMADTGAGLFSEADSQTLPFKIDDHVTVSTGVIDPNNPACQAK